MSWSLPVGGLLAALAVVAGAFGAHALRGSLDARGLELWETAARYLMYGALGLLAIGLASQRSAGAGGWAAAAWCLAIGTAIFAGTVFALALGGPRLLGAVTPVGGALMIAGFVLFAWAAWRTHS